jgi:alpha-mannosidase
LTSFEITCQSEEKVILTFKFYISEKSSLIQNIYFYCDSPRVDFRTDVDWYESKKLLKAYFPLNLRTDFATFEIGSGLYRRPIHTNTTWD